MKITRFAQAKNAMGLMLLASILIGCGSESQKTSSTVNKTTSAVCQGKQIQNAIIESSIDETLRRMGQTEGIDETEMRKNLRTMISNSMKFSLSNVKVLGEDSGATKCQAQMTVIVKPNPKAPEMKRVINDVVYKVSIKNGKTSVRFNSEFWEELDNF